VRDLYSGRQMAKVMSFAMIVFSLVPAIAPLIGTGIIWLAGWRAIFVAFMLFTIFSVGWLALRQPETLGPQSRRPLNPSSILAGTREILCNRQVLLVIAVLSPVFGVLFATISTTQLVFDQTYGQAASFPYWFGAVALVSALGSFLNAHIVVRLGMRQVVRMTLISQIGFSAFFALIALSGLTGPIAFYLYVTWVLTIFTFAGLTIGNLNALGMEPLGHLAGLGASVIGSVATVGAVAIAVPIGLIFDGTPLPIALGVLICCIVALWLSGFLRPHDSLAMP